MAGEVIKSNGNVHKSVGNVLTLPKLNTESRSFSNLTTGIKRGMAYKSSTNTLYIANNNNILIYDLTTMTQTGTILQAAFAGNTPWGLDYDPVGNRLFISNTTNSTVSIYNLTSNTNQVITTAQGNFNAPRGIAFSPDTNTLYVNGSGLSILTIPGLALTYFTRNALGFSGGGGTLGGLCMDRTNKLVYIFQNSTTTGIVKMDMLTNTVVEFAPPFRSSSLSQNSVAFDPGRNFVYLCPSVSTNGVVTILDVGKGIMSNPFTFPIGSVQSATCYGLCYDDVNKRLFVSSSVTDTISILKIV